MSEQPLRRQSPDSYRPAMAPKALKMIQGGKAMNEQQALGSQVRKSPVSNRIGSVFIPVKDIEESRSWYCRLLGLNENECEIMNGHLCPLPMEGTGVILDTMPMWGGRQPSGAPAIETPAFMFLTDDLVRSYEYIKELGVELVTAIEYDHWFVVKDPSGNKIMICRG